jgi:cellulose synthase/poly-beta-1,6-N-acetylglucosamine synthase-like glycosyltransferase
MSLVEVLLVSFAIILLFPSLVIFIQIVFASLSEKHKDIFLPNMASIAVLIPAHNESSGIIATLNSIQPQLRTQDCVLVVADNCSDDTAEIAAQHGAEVIVRSDSKNLGKGFALDFGLKYLTKNPPQVVVIIDADCIVEADALNQLAASALENGRPVQALYLMYAKDTNLKSKISEFAWCVKNLVRPLGCANLGMPCQLMGTGMAFPWNMLVNADLANGNIVEDMKLGIDLAIAGTPPFFYSGSKVTSYFPLASEAQSGQKTRWEHGHLAMLIAEAPRLFITGVAKRDVSLLAMAFDLAVPPLALLVMLLFGYAALTSTILLMANVGYLAFTITICALIILTVAIAIAWWGWGRSIISLRSLLYIPIYIILKIPHYFKFLFKRQKTWNKTERD